MALDKLKGAKLELILFDILNSFFYKSTGYKKGLFPINNSQLVTRNTYVIGKQVKKDVFWLAINIVVGITPNVHLSNK